ncbi:MAG: tRNA adenosine(34) deaminase TadA [Gammaproteobacteria bacterium]|nr:tRNA adenosine(34) deaminase TadA [Gammaproteobacteria bacterium]
MQVNDIDQRWLQYALDLAKKAANQNEVPVGAVVVLNNEVIGEGYNQPITLKDPTAHAEIIALRDAAKNVGNYRLNDTTLYVTLEPCVMCAGSLIHARIKRLVFGAHDLKAGAIESQIQLLSMKSNHQVAWQGGLMAPECLLVLQDFFRAKR